VGYKRQKAVGVIINKLTREYLKNMDCNKFLPDINVSDSVLFLLRGAKKRRSMAVAKAKMIQGQLGVIPRLVAVK